MMGLAAAVVISSVLGSLHCVGMCGPLALWASGAGQSNGRGQQQATHQVWIKLGAYHFGRLITYSVAGALAGLVGSMVSAGGSLVGLQSLAARLVGGAMIAMGIVRLFELAMPSVMQRRSPAAEKSFGNGIAGWVARRRPWIQRLPGVGRGVAAGALTTLLPCGWLYVFVLVAGGTGGVLSAMLVMFAFWIGTLPALTALVAGSIGLATKVRPALPVFGCVLLLLTGFYTATGRAAADLQPLTQRARELANQGLSSDDAMRRLVDDPLPCCVDSK